MGLLPRRLQHHDGATLVEHLEELRSRIIIVLGALAMTTIVAFAFHGHILDWLNHPLPADRRRVVTLGVAEPFTVSVTVSIYAGFLLATGLILREFSADISSVAGALAFGDAFGSWLLLWCVFTAGLTYAAYYVNMPAFLAFALLTVAYLLLGLANISNPGDTATLLTKLGGWVLIADGLCAWYLSWGLAVNSVVGDRIPLFPHPYAGAETTEAPADITPMPVA